MKVLLTGAAGFIGTRVAAALAEAGHEVVAVDAMLTAAHGPDGELPTDVRRVDVRDAAALGP
ncbi:MAG: NAD-dependent epimerase/dehydratase family protein, partial [Mycobacterium sp.]|uniref:NAD-dependent epimerase/dehydratase family protein n=1 Tax=Mycobacterium sp. TaxID=1785 RepID=UPI00389B0854